MGGSGKGKRRRRLPARGGGLLWAGIWVLLLLTTIIVGTVTLNRLRLGRSRLGKCPAVAADCGPCARTRPLPAVPRPLTTRCVAGIPWSNVCGCLGCAELCDDCHWNLLLGGAWNDVIAPVPRNMLLRAALDAGKEKPLPVSCGLCNIYSTPAGPTLVEKMYLH
jgi:hypothetical protein